MSVAEALGQKNRERSADDFARRVTEVCSAARLK